VLVARAGGLTSSPPIFCSATSVLLLSCVRAVQSTTLALALSLSVCPVGCVFLCGPCRYAYVGSLSTHRRCRSRCSSSLLCVADSTFRSHAARALLSASRLPDITTFVVHGGGSSSPLAALASTLVAGGPPHVSAVSCTRRVLLTGVVLVSVLRHCSLSPLSWAVPAACVPPACPESSPHDWVNAPCVRVAPPLMFFALRGARAWCAIPAVFPRHLIVYPPRCGGRVSCLPAFGHPLVCRFKSVRGLTSPCPPSGGFAQ